MPTGPASRTRSPVDAEQAGSNEEEKLEQAGNSYEKLHLTLEGAEWAEKLTQWTGGVFAQLHNSLYFMSQTSSWSWKLMLPPDWSQNAEAVREIFGTAEDTLKILGDYAPVVQLLDAQTNLRQAKLEESKGQYGAEALDLSNAATKGWLGGSLLFGATSLTLGAASLIGLGVPLGIDAVKAAVLGTEQPIDAIDRFIEKHTGSNPNLGDLFQPLLPPKEPSLVKDPAHSGGAPVFAPPFFPSRYSTVDPENYR